MKSSEHYFLFASCLITLFIFELLAITFSYDLYIFFLIHLFISTTTGLIAFIFYQKKWDLRLPILSAIFTFTLGPFGIGMILITLPLVYLNLQKSLSLPEIVSSYFFQEFSSPRTLLYERIMAQMEELSSDKVPPLFQNYMTFGTVEQKSLAIQKMLRYFSPLFVPLLKLGLNDASNAIRVQAATALNSINHSFFQKFLLLQKKVNQKKFDNRLLLQFADHSRIYATSQLADEERTRYIRQNSIEAYEKLALTEGLSNPLRLHLSQLYVVEYPEHAYQLLEPILDASNTPSEAYQYTIEALVKLKKFEVLRSLAVRKLNDQNQLPENIREMFLLWSKGGNDDRA